MKFTFLSRDSAVEELDHARVQRGLSDCRAVILYDVDREGGLFEDWEIEKDCEMVETWLDLLEYVVVDFWHENGVYYKIVEKSDNANFEDDDFMIISQELQDKSTISLIEMVTVVVC